MINNIYEIDTIVDEILKTADDKTSVTVKKARGRRKRDPIPTWALDFYNPARNRTFALISMCIKDDFDQSIEELAFRVAKQKSVSPAKALEVLLNLKARGQLGYYDNITRHFINWRGTEVNNELESTRN